MAAGFVDFKITWQGDVFSGAPQHSSAASFGALGINFRARNAADDAEWNAALSGLACHASSQAENEAEMGSILGADAFAGPRYFGFVIGGALPATLAANWLPGAWVHVDGAFGLWAAAAPPGAHLMRRFAEGLREAGYEILNDVVLNQVLVSFGDAETTRRVIAGVQEEGTCWCGGTVWQGRTAMRISVSSWATTDQDVERGLEAILRAAAVHAKLNVAHSATRVRT